MDVGTVVSVASGLLFFGLTIASWVARHASSERRASRELRVVNVAAVRYLYKLDLWAAMHGIELPERPKELKADYLEGRAIGSSAPDLAELAQMIAQFTHTKEGEKP